LFILGYITTAFSRKVREEKQIPIAIGMQRTNLFNQSFVIFAETLPAL